MAGVPRAERVLELDRDLAAARVRACRERRLDVDEPHRDGVEDPEPKPPRLGEEHEERVVDRQERRLEARDEVDVEQEAPDRPRRRRGDTDRLDHGEMADVDGMLELRLQTVEGIGGGPSLELEQYAVQRSAAAARLGRIVELSVPPPAVAAREHPGAKRGV